MACQCARLPAVAAASQPATHLDALQAAGNLALDERGDQVAAALHRRQRHLLPKRCTHKGPDKLGCHACSGVGSSAACGSCKFQPKRVPYSSGAGQKVPLEGTSNSLAGTALKQNTLTCCRHTMVPRLLASASGGVGEKSRPAQATAAAAVTAAARVARTSSAAQHDLHSIEIIRMRAECYRPSHWHRVFEGSAEGLTSSAADCWSSSEQPQDGDVRPG